ncbi:MAG: glycogen/starch/alpha-glucan phosphorylase, partial [Firmicutes bacterium]|nr:glycogen/starch/alpha-glucan phosphorylase [Bacillota bacterium]
MFVGKENFKAEYTRSLVENFAKPLADCTPLEKYENLVKLVMKTASAIRTETSLRHAAEHQKKIYYFSMEFLIGKLLDNYLINLGIRDIVAEGLSELGESLDALEAIERDPGLGNGGLGRLAACFLDSMASIGVPGVGMGIRYRFGLFRQKIENGYQVEEPDAWLENGNPWEQAKPDESVLVRFGGYVDRQYKDGKISYEHKGYSHVKAVPYDVPIVGYGSHDVNVLRLWYAQPVHDRVDLAAFNRGDYAAAMKERADIEAITCIRYPDDSNGTGRTLRLKQEYFFVAAGIASILRQYKKVYGSTKEDLMHLPEHVSIHINDTHPTLCIPELMRVLMDEEGFEWNEAWDITCRTVSFTNHTVLPEALEKWSIDLFKSLLPRVYMIVEEIDKRWREVLDKESNLGPDTRRNTAVLWDGEVRMANLSVIGSHSVNGVAALHSEILKETVFKDFYTLQPDKFNNKTNGISHRRFLIQSNPGLTKLITEAIGDGWKTDMTQISRLENFRSDAAFIEKLLDVKYQNKLRLADYLYQTSGVKVDPNSVFDVQVKRIHAYKRQLLNAFKVLDLYNQLKANPDLDINPYTFVFSGKAAQGYAYAKEVIKFINSVADVVNNDPVVSQKIRVVYVENFCVSNAQLIYPAADISEQISTAGKEASGTGNMKFMMNGAVTLGTLDGANVEIANLVGPENITIFGLTSDEAMNYYVQGGYNSKDECKKDPRLETISSQLVNGFFKNSGKDFWGIYDALLQHNDEYFVLKDFDSYTTAWRDMDKAYSDALRWGSMSTMNIARSAFFSSDRTI